MGERDSLTRPRAPSLLMHSTCWTMIKGAAAGDDADRREFARRYLAVVRAYLLARWRGSPLLAEVDDAIQDVFVEAFRDGGALSRVEPDREGGFRPFLYGVVRNVAMRTETAGRRRKEAQAATRILNETPGPTEEQLSQIFDRAWARTVMREAAERQRESAAAAGESARRRVELLRLRFHEGLPIRRIAALWNADPEHLHREYARAREEFRDALRAVVAFHHPAGREAVERECAQLLAMLG